MNETPVQQRARVRASELGITLWRNNSGACYDQTGRLIRYGLANDSEALNRQIKSGDLIGITPVMITPDMVGKVVGVFTSLECKREGWRLTPSDARGQAQLRYAELVRSQGGFAGFVSSPDDVALITGRKR